MNTREDLRQLQSLPLEIKIEKSKQRIIEWYEHWGGKVAVSFSGGKDSTVLLHLVRSVYPSVPAIFVNTGIEYPDIKRQVKLFDNVVTLIPKKNFMKVLTEYGYPIISKDVAIKVEAARNAIIKNNMSSKCLMRLKGSYGQQWYNVTKYYPLCEVDFKTSAKCCNIMKKSPSKEYEKKTGYKLFIGTMAEESAMRREHWLRLGCNVFEGERQISKPLSFWTEQDILEYIVKYDLPIAKPYGEIVKQGCEYCTAGCGRTGCVFLWVRSAP